MALRSIAAAIALVACAQTVTAQPVANTSAVEVEATVDDFELPSNYKSTCGTHTTENPSRFDVSHCKGIKVGESCQVKCAEGYVGEPVSVKCWFNIDKPEYEPMPRPKCVPVCKGLPKVVGNANLYDLSGCKSGSAANTTCTATCQSDYAKGTPTTFRCRQGSASEADWVIETEGSCTWNRTWPKFVPLKPWVNKAWCPQWKGLPDICQGGLMDSKYPEESYIMVDGDVPESSVRKLKEQGHKVVCYISGGTFEGWRSDADQFPKSIIGIKMSDWDENWLDIRRSNPDHEKLLALMDARVKVQAEKGCDAIEYDNVDCWINRCVKGQKPHNRYMYGEQIYYNKFLAFTAHKYGMAVGHKNNVEQIPEIVNDFDFGVNEECFRWNECHYYKAFIDQNKAVIGTSYNYDNAWKICSEAIRNKWTWMLKDQRTWILCELEWDKPAPQIESPGIREFTWKDKDMSH